MMIRHLARRLIGSVRAGRLLESPLLYAVRELLPRDREAFYVPRGSDLGLLLRHHSPDISIVREVFGMKVYEPPPPVLAALARLERPPRMLDLGGHIGAFGVFALTLAPTAYLASLEPDPASYALLSANARRSGRAWTVLEAAAATNNGWARFAATGGPDAGLCSTGNSDVRDAEDTTVLTLDVLPLLQRVDIAKIDIEGGEWPIFDDPRWPTCAPNLLALEFHPEGCARSDYRAAALDAVGAAGMEHMIVPDPPAGAGMLWAWRDA